MSDHPAPLNIAEADLPDGPEPGTVCIGYLSGTDVANDFAQAMLHTRDADHSQGWNRLQHRNWWINQRSGVNVSRPRNLLVAKFLSMRDPAPEWLLMVDADMLWTAGAVESLVISATETLPELGIPAGTAVVGGLCLAFGNDPDKPGSIAVMSTCFDQGDPIPGISVPPFKVLRAKEVQRNAMREVYGTGAAFLLIHRQTLIDIAGMVGQQFPWFREVIVPDTREVPYHLRNDYWISEDLFFTLQCHKAGHRVFVNTAVEIQHVKPIRLTEKLWRSYGRVVDCA